jgi:hypothetical protein
MENKVSLVEISEMIERDRFRRKKGIEDKCGLLPFDETKNVEKGLFLRAKKKCLNLSTLLKWNGLKSKLIQTVSFLLYGHRLPSFYPLWP